MAPQKPTLIVFTGGMRGTPVERLVGEARDAAALDTVERGLASGAFAGVLLIADEQRVAAEAPPGVAVEIDAEEFDFGERLRRAVAEHRIERPFYVGGGSIPLLDAAGLATLAERLATQDQLVLSNNYYSADIVGWVPGSAIEQLPAIPSDNSLPQLLHREAGLPSEAMERSIASQFDIDTPSDLAVLKLYGASGPRLRAFLDRAPLDLSRYERAMAFFLEPAMVLIAGRVGSAVWQYLEHETACRIRLFSEERGMQADGRERSGQVRSILGLYLEQTDFDGLFRALAELGDAVFLDTRVLLAHAQVFPSRPDRFLSDLGRWQEIEDPFLRELTRAAAEATVPVVLGGHSLVSGGIMALVQAAWDIHDRENGPNPRHLP
jgi:2-phospho-L-lactate guanylyltransferase (CobY/MobA/RfbA family)